MKTKYQIKIYYSTGNSFGSENTEDLIDYEWENIKYAQQSINNIKNHYEFYEKNDDHWHKPKGKIPEGVYWDEEFRMIGLKLVDDNGKQFKYSSFWTGYFDKLHLAEIIVKESPLGSYRAHY